MSRLVGVTMLLAACAPQAIQTDRAPAAVGPYAQAVRADGFIFVSGQIAPDAGGIREQTRAALSQIEAIAGTRIVKTTVYMTDLSEFAAMNEAYAEFFGDRRPARATVQVSALPKGARIEIEAVAVE